MYTFKNTEQNNQKASEYETKSLLYLLCMRKDSKDIDVLMIDCFNDVTGGNDSLDALWDVQSKGVKSLRPKTVGVALVTLFKNYFSQIEFNHYILFIPKLREGYLNDESLTTYSINNFKDECVFKIKEGLCTEFIKRNKDDDLKIVEIEDFLSKVTFVVADTEKENYTKNIVNFKNKDIKSKKFFIELFDEIRDMQTALKNNCIEGITISSVKDVLNFNRVIKKNDLEVVTINRLIGIDIFNKNNIPFEFLCEIKELNKDDVKDIIQDCNESLSRTLFNKDSKEEFWTFMEKVVKVVKDNPKKSSRKLFNMIPRKVIKRVHTLDEISCIYFISLVQEGLL
ncbi:hypothetical protein Curi_c11000 [Gottschalkia acidurici 9a]|uniref:Uncharacterized protein n=1 Tax=Gottschalkia acidurici (strain ATCC 7906 / DSM 604 / BCRC 14475 / CIP 104303 / KCTC 5404 / NCIMB 10678 / 9a) TaxID=1128398 RepID=K0AY21_GOTA9|nr:hypothetical protein [Gottschalkia acidurici]AFS78114.1 hypothetical protein Curi_c11000 [Gottschalkia acidurici 9a]